MEPSGSKQPPKSTRSKRRPRSNSETEQAKQKKYSTDKLFTDNDMQDSTTSEVEEHARRLTSTPINTVVPMTPESEQGHSIEGSKNLTLDDTSFDLDSELEKRDKKLEEISKWVAQIQTKIDDLNDMIPDDIDFGALEEMVVENKEALTNYDNLKKESAEAINKTNEITEKFETIAENTSETKEDMTRRVEEMEKKMKEFERKASELIKEYEAFIRKRTDTAIYKETQNLAGKTTESLQEMETLRETLMRNEGSKIAETMGISQRIESNKKSVAENKVVMDAVSKTILEIHKKLSKIEEMTKKINESNLTRDTEAKTMRNDIVELEKMQQKLGNLENERKIKEKVNQEIEKKAEKEPTSTTNNHELSLQLTRELPEQIESVERAGEVRAEVMLEMFIETQSRQAKLMQTMKALQETTTCVEEEEEKKKTKI